MVDFGMARSLNSSAEPVDDVISPSSGPTAAFMTAQCGTLEWMAVCHDCFLSWSVLTSSCLCPQPELCERALEVSRKFDATRKDPRGRAAALESYRAFRDGSKNTEYSQMVDVYAFAVVMYEMTSHQPPWDTGVGENEIREKVCHGQRPAMPDIVEDRGPSGWTELMERCWHEDARQRPTFSEAWPALVRMRDACSTQEEGDEPTQREGAVSSQEARRGSEVPLDTYIRLDDEDAEEDAAAEEAFKARLARI